MYKVTWIVSSNINIIPEFDSNGNLPPGEHRTNLDSIKDRFTWNPGRKVLFEGLEKAIENLRNAGVWKIYIDGSFITEKDNPSDVDGCWVPDSKVNAGLLDPVFLDTESMARMKKKYGVHFLIVGINKGKVSTQPIEEGFQFDRDGNAKGILLLEC